jgi:acetyl-CoA C-acetyltransferase
MENRVYIVAARRTAIGKFLGTLAPVSAADLAATVIRDILTGGGTRGGTRTAIDPARIDEVIVGNVLSAGLGQGVARQAAIRGGVPFEVPAWGVNMICGSGMKAIINAYASISSGLADLILAGGTESMSQAGFVIGGGVRAGHKTGNMTALDSMVTDGLTDAFSGLHMGVTAENVAAKYGITREAQDSFALTSQRRAVAAIDGGRFRDEIVQVEIAGRKETVVFDTDEFPNRATDAEKLASLRPAFQKDGTVTAGNASGINDGAAFVLVASSRAVDELGLTPLVEIVATGQGGVDPAVMGIGPVAAVGRVLERSGHRLAEIEVMELNEAFAAQSLAVVKLLAAEHGVTENWIRERTNVNGGALALGHPIGASGCRIVVSLVWEMLRSGRGLGLASLCIGGGMGTALVLRSL